MLAIAVCVNGETLHVRTSVLCKVFTPMHDHHGAAALKEADSFLSSEVIFCIACGHLHLAITMKFDNIRLQGDLPDARGAHGPIYSKAADSNLGVSVAPCVSQKHGWYGTAEKVKHFVLEGELSVPSQRHEDRLFIPPSGRTLGFVANESAARYV